MQNRFDQNHISFACLQNIYANASHFIGKAAPASRSADTNLNVSTNLNASSSNNASPSTNTTNTTRMDSSSNQSYHDLNSTKLSPIRSGSSASSTNAVGQSYAHQQRHQGQPRTPRHSQRRQRGRMHGGFDNFWIYSSI